MRRQIYIAFLSAIVLLGGSGLALAQAVERSGNVYHMRVCPGPGEPRSARCHAHVVTTHLGQIIRNAGPASGSYGPTDLQNAYGVTQSVTTSTPITGPWIAIVDAYGYPNAESDLAVYRKQYGLPPCTTANGCFKKVNQNGGTTYPKKNTGWAQEQALDLDMVSAICPLCHILLVEASSNSYSNLGKAVDCAAGKAAGCSGFGPLAISNSYGGGESTSSFYEPYYNHPGIAVTASSGDSGYGVEFPAVSPHVTAVGGTRLVRSANARGWGETIWSGAGSGCSTVYAKPSWQHDTGCSMRMEADVSAIADPGTGVAVYGPAAGSVSAWMVFGGTSVAAPLIAGIYGRNGGPVNYGSDPYSYAGNNWPYAYNPNVNLVTSGSNGSCGGSYFCTAGNPSTYSGPGGLGTPKTAKAF